MHGPPAPMPLPIESRRPSGYLKKDSSSVLRPHRHVTMDNNTESSTEYPDSVDMCLRLSTQVLRLS
jgi:hypothetical protein